MFLQLKIARNGALEKAAPKGLWEKVGQGVTCAMSVSLLRIGDFALDLRVGFEEPASCPLAEQPEHHRREQGIEQG